MGRAATRQLLAALDLQPGQRILEIGCGTGSTAVQIAQDATLGVIGMDALPAMLQAARQRVRIAGVRQRLSLVLASGAAVPFPAQTFDRIYTESVLGFQNSAAATAMLGQIFRLLKPDGRYVANEAIWKPEVTDAQAAAIYAANMADFGISQASEQAWGLAEWTTQMQAAGFELLSADRLAQADLGAGIEDGRVPPPVKRSDRLTRLWRLKRFLWPRLARQAHHYRQLLAAHQADGRLIESRLFVLIKPMIA